MKYTSDLRPIHLFASQSITNLVGRQLKLKRSLENEFCSTTLGTSVSLLFCLVNNPNNAMLKVLHCIPYSFRTISA